MNLSLTNPERLPWAALLRQAWYNNLFLSFIALSNILPFITFHYLSGPCQLGSISHIRIKLFPITQTVVGLRCRFHASFMVLAIRCLKSLVNALNVNTSLDIKYEHLILMNNNRYWTNFTSTIITKLVRYIPDDSQNYVKTSFRGFDRLSTFVLPQCLNHNYRFQQNWNVSPLENFSTHFKYL